MSEADPFGRLPREVRRRLDAFSAAVDQVDLDRLSLFAVRPRGTRHEAATATAADVAAASGRVAAVEAARNVAVDYIARRVATGMRIPRMGQTGGPTTSSSADRVDLARSFAEAITAIALEDLLDDDVAAELLGPWAELLPDAS